MTYVTKLEHYLRPWFHNDVDDSANRVAQLIFKTQGVIYLLGIGKSGRVVQMFSDLLKSVGIKSFLLCNQNLVHGDLGCIDELDTILCVSNSGNTAELSTSFEYIRKRKAETILLTTNKTYKLQADQCYVLPQCTELDPGFNLIPSSSLVGFTIFTSLVIRHLCDLLHFNVEKYSRNHPSGSIGAIITTRVVDTMKPFGTFPVVEVDSEHNAGLISDIMLQMSQKRIGMCCFIRSNRTLLGIITNGMIIKYLTESNERLPRVFEILCKQPVVLTDAKQLVCTLNPSIKHRWYPVVADGNILVGIFENLKV